MLAVLMVVNEVSGAPPLRDLSTEILPENLSNSKGNVSTPSELQLNKMNAYWFEKMNFCGNILDKSLADTCSMYYHGNLSPFQKQDFASNVTESHQQLRLITEECCVQPCSRWVMKNYCDPNPSFYNPTTIKPPTSTKPEKPTSLIKIFECTLISSFCRWCLIDC